jgi:hypothetical protein
MRFLMFSTGDATLFLIPIDDQVDVETTGEGQARR